MACQDVRGVVIREELSDVLSSLGLGRDLDFLQCHELPHYL